MKLKALTVAGLNSGTSMDGIDVAIFTIEADPTPESRVASTCPALKCKLLAQEVCEFDPILAKRMSALINSGNASLEELCRLDAVLGEAFAAAFISVSRKIGDLHVDLIGSHGQTFWHAPRQKTIAGHGSANTMQLGQAAIIAERTGVPVYADFRVADVAAGGQGAPLVSFADQVLFGREKRGLGILNLGGIANITVLDKTGRAIMAFDTGPANMLIDRACEKLFGRSFDEDGKLASSGEIKEDWLSRLLELSYFRMPPPKTTGREIFGFAFADGLIEEGLRWGLAPESVLATLTALTAASIARQYDEFIKSKVKIEKIVLGGGGAENKTVSSLLQKYWPNELDLARHEDYGISTKFKESLLFALLAYTSHLRIPNNVPQCTGARRPVCLGKLCSP